MKKIVLWLVLLILLALPLTWPFFRPGFFPTDDGEWAVVRLGAMHRALTNFHFPVRWASNLNFSYGYPLFLFTYPLPYYLGEVFNFLGFGLVGAIKILFILSVLFSGVAMFLLAREIFGLKGGFIASLFYLYAPFRLVDLYVRGSLGESLAFVWYPLLFLSLIKFKQNPRCWLALGAIFYGALILTHNVSALLITPFLVIFAFLSSPRRSLGIFVLGVGLAFFFLFPALSEKSKIALSQIPLADKSEHFVSLKQLVIPSWGYGPPNSKEAFSFQLGWVHWLAFLVAFVFWLKKRVKNKLDDSIFAFSSVFLVVTILLMLPVSGFFWQLPFFKEIDFPWRLLGPASFFLALSLGYLSTKRLWQIVAMVLVILVILVNFKYAQPKALVDYPDSYYLTNEATTTSADELMPVWVKEKPIKRPEKKVEILTGQGEIKNLFFDAKKTAFVLEAKTEIEVQINTVYFPGWQAKIDNKQTAVDYQNKQGLIQLKIPPGNHQVVVAFKETPLWLAADIVSLCGLLVTGGLLVKIKKNEN